MAAHQHCRCADCNMERAAITCWSCKPNSVAERFFRDYPEWSITERVPEKYEVLARGSRSNLQGWYGTTRTAEPLWVWLCPTCIHKFHVQKQFRKLVRAGDVL